MDSSASSVSDLNFGKLKRKGILVLITLAISAGFFVGEYFQEKKTIFTDVDSESACVNSLCGSQKDCCVIWNNGKCRKGKIDGDKCVSDSNIPAIILYTLGAIFAMYFLVLFFQFIRLLAR